MFEENTDIVYGDLADLSFPDPLPNSPSQITYPLKAGNPARAGKVDQYSVDITILLDTTGIDTSKPAGVVGAVAGLSRTTQGVLNTGNGNTTLAPNPTQASKYMNYVSLGASNSAQINISGNCLTLAENGLNLGISNFNSAVTGINITNVVYSYRYLGPVG